MYAIVLHAHQRLDKIARQALGELLSSDAQFPSYRDIVQFEGQHGPDSTRLKKGNGQEQPWHFYDPRDVSDTQLLDTIGAHYHELVAALSMRNQPRAAFEAAWLAHALVDGLTPAHHFPYEAELERLRGGKSRHTREGLRGRAIVQGETPSDSLRKSMQLIGPKGLLMNHTTFEAGAYTIAQTMRFRKDAFPPESAFAQVEEQGLEGYFAERARAVAAWQLYERFMERGWTQSLAHAVRRQLIPEMVQIIILAWYSAAKEADLPVGVMTA